jgi:hypothetical protein
VLVGLGTFLGFMVLCILLVVLAAALFPLCSYLGDKMRAVVLDGTESYLERDAPFKLSSEAQRSLARLVAAEPPPAPMDEVVLPLLTATTDSPDVARAALERRLQLEAVAVQRLSKRVEAAADAEELLRKSEWWMGQEHARLLVYALRDVGWATIVAFLRGVPALVPAAAVAVTVIWALSRTVGFSEWSYFEAIGLGAGIGIVAGVLVAGITILERVLACVPMTFLGGRPRLLRLFFYGAIALGAAWFTIGFPLLQDSWFDREPTREPRKDENAEPSSTTVAIGFTLLFAFLLALMWGSARSWRNRTLPLWERLFHLSAVLLFGSITFFGITAVVSIAVWPELMKGDGRLEEVALRVVTIACFGGMVAGAGLGYWSWVERRRTSGRR